MKTMAPFKGRPLLKLKEIEKRITEILAAMNEMARQNPELFLIEHR